MVVDDNEKPPEGGEVVSIEDARKKAEEKTTQEGEAQPQPGPGANFLEPVMQAIGRELAQLAGPDGKINLNLSHDELQRAKTAALIKGIGEGLGAALAQVFSKWADKIDIKVDMGTPPTNPEAPPSTTPPAAPGGDDDKNKPS